MPGEPTGRLHYSEDPAGWAPRIGPPQGQPVQELKTRLPHRKGLLALGRVKDQWPGAVIYKIKVKGHILLQKRGRRHSSAPARGQPRDAWAQLRALVSLGATAPKTSLKRPSKAAAPGTKLVVCITAKNGRGRGTTVQPHRTQGNGPFYCGNL